MLQIDWDNVGIGNDTEATALWGQIAPRPDDWDDKLREVPPRLTRPLAIAMLHAGNFRCAPPTKPGDCTQDFDMPDLKPDAGLSDPCLRRLLALWSIEQLEPEDIPNVLAALKGIVALPAPESQLVDAAIKAVPETDQDSRLALLAVAQAAGQDEIAANGVAALDEAHQVTAASTHHIGGALDTLSAQTHRPVFLAALTDDALPTKARLSAMSELIDADDKPPPDLRTALAKAATAKDCTVAAAAARALERLGDKRFVPSAANTKPATPDKLVRAMCVLASYEMLQGNEEASLLAGYVPAKGLERVTVTYDALSDVDTDGDGDPHTSRTVELVPRDASLVLPEIEDLVKAMQHCTGTTCTSEDREYRFVTAAGGTGVQLKRLELVERPPCHK